MAEEGKGNRFRRQLMETPSISFTYS